VKPQEELALLGKQLNNALALLERIHEDHDTADQELFHIWHTLRLECASAWERHSAVLKGETKPATAHPPAEPSLLSTPPRSARHQPESRSEREPAGTAVAQPDEPAEELTAEEAEAEGLEAMPVLRKKPHLKKAVRDLAGNPVFDPELDEAFSKGLDSAAAELLDEVQKKGQ